MALSSARHAPTGPGHSGTAALTARNSFGGNDPGAVAGRRPWRWRRSRSAAWMRRVAARSKGSVAVAIAGIMVPPPESLDPARAAAGSSRARTVAGTRPQRAATTARAPTAA